MYMSNTIPKRKFFKKNSAEIDRNGNKAYRVPFQFPVTACIDYNNLRFSIGKRSNIKRKSKNGK